MPFSMTALIVPAVPSGLRVKVESPVAETVYISFCTTSVVSPTLLTKSPVSSNVGTLISLKPNCSAASLATRSTVCHLYICAGVISCVPFGLFTVKAIVLRPFIKCSFNYYTTSSAQLQAPNSSIYVCLKQSSPWGKKSLISLWQAV